MVAEEVVEKLKLETRPHLNPYQLSWLKKGSEVKVSKRCLVHFSIASKYKDKVWYVVVTMDACHLLLGKPWQYDRDKQIVLAASKDIVSKPVSGGGSNLLNYCKFVGEIEHLIWFTC